MHILLRRAAAAPLRALLLGACAEPLTLAPDVQDAQFARGAPKPAPTPYSWTISATSSGFSSDGKGSYIAGTCGVSGQVYFGESDDAVLSIDANAKKCARTAGIVYPSGFRQVGMFVNLTQAAAITDGASAKRRLILNPGQYNRNDACGRIIFGGGGVNNVGAGSDSVNVARVGNSWTITGTGLHGWCEKLNVLVVNDVNFTINNE
ncbi:MAG: hypothetical protein C0516_10565 [Gemmatimonas sp.]|nr:hypothetical protein [Gemmatimonas sp.]